MTDHERYAWLRTQIETSKRFDALTREVLLKIVSLHARGPNYLQQPFRNVAELRRTYRVCITCNRGFPCPTLQEVASLYADKDGYAEHWGV